MNTVHVQFTRLRKQSILDDRMVKMVVEQELIGGHS